RAATTSRPTAATRRSSRRSGSSRRRTRRGAASASSVRRPSGRPSARPSASASRSSVIERSEANLEIKAVDPDPEATLAAALALGARDEGTLHQRDTYFHAVQGRLKLREARV